MIAICFARKNGTTGLDQLRVLHVITGLGLGGAERMLVSLLAAADRERVSMAVISLTDDGVMGDEIRGLGIPLEAMGMRSGFPSPALLARLVSRIRAYRPALVQTWMYHADLLGGLAARFAGASRLVWGLHNSDLDPERTKTLTRLVARACGPLSRVLPNRIVSCSTSAMELHARLGYARDKFTVIPNGFDIRSFHPDPSARGALREALGLDDRRLLVGLVARFDPQKDHRNFIAAAARVGAPRDDVDFVLIGKDCDEANRELGAWIADTGLAGRFHLLGIRRDVQRLIPGLDLSVTSSAYGEAFPLVLGESMACGVPCVATDVGDSAHIVGDTGRVVPPGDPGALGGAIGELLALGGEERAALARAARERIVTRFSIEAIAARYLALYEGLCRGARHAAPSPR